MVGNTTTRRPSHEILNSGLRFDHFVAPFKVYPPKGGTVDGFVSVGDALDYALRSHFRTGDRFDVADAIDELVYSVES